MRLYVAGPMSGLPDSNYPKFASETSKLRDAGFEVYSPAETSRPKTDKWSDFMRDGLTLLLKCDGVALLHGWKDSRGASLEVQVAQALGMPVKLVEEWLYV